jgi:hypothetical protein
MSLEAGQSCVYNLTSWGYSMNYIKRHWALNWLTGFITRPLKFLFTIHYGAIGKFPTVCSSLHMH